MSLVREVAWAKREFSSVGTLHQGVHTGPSTVDFRYSLLFASRGANVVVNDFNAAAAQKVVDEITKGQQPYSVILLSHYL